MSDWITSTEASAILGMSPQWLRDTATTDPSFPRPYQPGERKFFWSRAAIVAYRDKLLDAVAKPKKNKKRKSR